MTACWIASEAAPGYLSAAMGDGHSRRARRAWGSVRVDDWTALRLAAADAAGTRNAEAARDLRPDEQGNLGDLAQAGTHLAGVSRSPLRIALQQIRMQRRQLDWRSATQRKRRHIGRQTLVQEHGRRLAVLIARRNGSKPVTSSCSKSPSEYTSMRGSPGVPPKRSGAM